MEKAHAVSLENLAVIRELRDESSRAAALATLAEVYAATGLEFGAEEKAAVKAMTNQVD